MRRDADRRLIEAIHAAPAADDAAEAERAFLVFEVAGEERAVDANAVEAVTRASFVARVPYGPPGLLGVSSVRGRMRLVVDASVETGEGRSSAAAYFVLLHGEGQVALAADRVLGVRRAAEGDAAPARLVDPETLLES